MFAVLHIADFALHAVLRNERNAAGRPAALFASTGKKSLVLAANPAARALGVEPGLTAPQAAARCPTLLIRAPHADAEAEARAALLATGFTLSPTIEETAPGVCTADLKGGERANLSPPVQAAVAELHRLGLPATAGIADTPLLALYAARAATDPIPVLHVSDSTSFLAPLPLAAADPTPELAGVLRHWGPAPYTHRCAELRERRWLRGRRQPRTMSSSRCSPIPTLWAPGSPSPVRPA